MRVCFVVSKLPTEGITGGAQLQCYLVGKGLAERGWDVKFATLSCITGTPAAERRSYTDPTRRRDAWIPRPPLYILKWTISLLRLLRRIDPEIVVVTGAFGVFNELNALCSIWFGKKLVYRAAHIWDADPTSVDLHLQLRGHAHPTDRFLRRYLYLFTLKRTHAIVANAQYVANAFKRLVPRKNIWVVPNGRQIESIRKSAPSHILWIARFERVKNPMLFVRLARELPNLPFVMCGFGSLVQETARRARHLGNLTILNSVDEDTKRDLLATAFVVVSTSMAEGFPNTLIEAGINAVPYISFVDPDEVICRYKLGFHVRSYSELAQKVELLVQDRDLREQIGSNIRAYVEEHHDIKNTVAEYDRLLRSIL